MEGLRGPWNIIEDQGIPLKLLMALKGHGGPMNTMEGL
jgi:hypothetical protein